MLTRLPTSLPLQLLTVLVLPLLILLIAVTFGAMSLHQIAMRDLVAGHDVQAVRGAAASLSERLEQDERILAALASQVSQEPRPQPLVGGWIETSFDGGAAFYDYDLRVLAMSPHFGASQPASPASPELIAALEQVQPGGETLFVPLIEPGRSSTEIAIVLSPAVPPGERIVRAAGIVSLDALGLPTLLGGLRTSDSATVMVAASDGLLLYHTDPREIGGWLPDAPHTRAALRGESGADTHTDLQGRELVTAFASVSRTGWTILQEERWAEMVSPLMRYSEAAPLVLIPGLAITALAVLFAIRSIVRPLQRLESRAADLAAGNFASIEAPVGGIEEIRRLQASLSAMADQLEKAQDAMRTYIGAITRAQEEERLRLSRELHDHTIQALIALDQRQQMLKRYLVEDAAAANRLAELRRMTADAIDELRRLIRAMRPIYLEELGLVPALEMLARDLDAEGEIAVRFDRQGQPRRLAPEQEMTLFRVAQESLNNVRRHSQAEHVWVSIRFDPAAVAISVQDDGVGFAAPHHVTDIPPNGHFGLLGMYERAALVDADLIIDSRPGKGTKVTIRAQTQSTPDA